MGERTHRTLGDQKSEQENVVPKYFGLLYFTGKARTTLNAFMKFVLKEDTRK